MRNPPWHRDEIILALDLYFKTVSGQIHARNPKIIELSKILNKLPIQRPDIVRTQNSVGLKWSNFNDRATNKNCQLDKNIATNTEINDKLKQLPDEDSRRTGTNEVARLS